ncbi:hypothetical protein [Pseudoalteromonas piratica]|uniref:Uncharacterized protein n=1 Tax=Pseudoalteromonas piratica TaxID=1348114 RepID=A0A0A7EL99_9GAMM|nr:hypothetical protein [Pseudoalteromonas piratica]AIY67414.1 hypothetical protein OM33_20500 [Pseudoalteromonas piratica]
MKLLLSLAILFAPIIAQANAKISYLNVDGNNVHFTLAADKTHTIPSCAIAETNQHYGVSLLTEAGRAMYSLLITAMSSKQAVSVVSGNDCNDVAGVERAQSISLMPDVSAAGGSAKAMYLYKSDGVTKLGRIYNSENINHFYYFPLDDNTKLREYRNTIWTIYYSPQHQLYFSETECQGAALVQYHGANTPRYVKNIGYNDGNLLSATGSSSYYNFKSIKNNSGECVSYNYPNQRATIATPHQDPICGNGPCIFKEE